MVGPWWRLRCHIVDAAGEAIEHRAQGWRDCGEQRGPRHAAVLGMSADVLSVAVQSASSLLNLCQGDRLVLHGQERR